MNEYQRQAYLSALGVDNYMPRWRLPWAPEPVACLLPTLRAKPQASSEPLAPSALESASRAQHPAPRHGNSSPQALADVLRDITGDAPARKHQVLVPVGERRELPTVTPVNLPAFSLSIWRPAESLLVIAERQARSALPVESLIHNLVQAAFGSVTASTEEVLRWPLVDNARISQSAADARIALGVWLETELQRRPAQQVWLMGAQAARFFVPESLSLSDALWSWQALEGHASKALIAPDPIQLLQQPLHKRQFWLALQAAPPG